MASWDCDTLLMSEKKLNVLPARFGRSLLDAGFVFFHIHRKGKFIREDTYTITHIQLSTIIRHSSHSVIVIPRSMD